MVQMSQLAVAILAAVLGSASAYHNPVIRIGPACASICTNYQYTVATDCIRCVFGAGWVPSWSNTSQPMYSFARMNLVEGGLDYAIAMPLQAPDGPTLMGTRAHTAKTRLVYTTLPKGVTVCAPDGSDCETRNMGPEIVRAEPGSRTGFCTEGAPAWLNLDPLCSTLDWPAKNTISFNNPEQLAGAYPSAPDGRRLEEYIPVMEKYNRALFDDSDVAADAIWYMNNVIWSSTMYFKHIGTEELSFLKSHFGADWDSSVQAKYDQGKLVMMDLATWIYNMRLNLTSTQAQPGSLMVFERITNDHDRTVLRCILLKLFDTGMKRVQPEVYSPKKGDGSAWRLAQVFARSSVVFHQIRIGHFYTYHVGASAYHYALYNQIDAGIPAKMSKHPLRQLLDEFTDPLIQNAIQFGTYTGASDPPYVAIKSPFYGQMHNLFVLSGGPLGNKTRINDGYGITPSGMMERSGLKVEDWTKKEDWDQYPQMQVQLGLEKLCNEYGIEIVKVFYNDGNALKKDKQLQNFLKALVDKEGSNLISVTKEAVAEITSRNQVGKIMGQIIFKTIIHACLHLLDYFKKNDNICAGPTRIDRAILPTPTRAYSEADMMALMPDAFSMAQQLFQGFTIAGVSPQGGPWLFPTTPGGSEVDWEAKLPFDSSTSKGKKANDLAIKFRKDIVKYVDSFEVDPYEYKVGMRQDNINFNYPWELTTHIDF